MYGQVVGRTNLQLLGSNFYVSLLGNYPTPYSTEYLPTEGVKQSAEIREKWAINFQSTDWSNTVKNNLKMYLTNRLIEN
jgi:hypothetical protein